jgi:hypothetical protein
VATATGGAEKRAGVPWRIDDCSLRLRSYTPRANSACLADAGFTSDLSWPEALVELEQDAGAVELPGRVDALLEHRFQRAFALLGQGEGLRRFGHGFLPAKVRNPIDTF